MYTRQNLNTDKPYQTVQLSTLRRKSPQKLIFYQNNKIHLNINQSQLSLIAILGVYHLANNQHVNQQLFNLINLELTPKIYHTYAHQKTLKMLLTFILDHNQSEQLIVELINQFSIFGFVIQTYIRAISLNYIKNHKELFLYGNQKQILENFQFDIRGNTLGILVDSLDIYLTLIYSQYNQTYGQDKNSKKVAININNNLISAECISLKNSRIPIHYIKSNQSSATKTLKQINSIQTQTSQSQQISSIDNNSLLKDNIATSQITKCEKCKLLKNRCLCSKKVIAGNDTPKSAKKIQRTQQPNNPINIFASLNHSRCVCHKLICNCRL